jgi:hypothetical protein
MSSDSPPSAEPQQFSPGEIEKHQEQLREAVSAAKIAQQAQSAAEKAQQRAAEVTDASLKKKALREVEIQKAKATEYIRKSEKLHNGAMQGGFMGGGIGAATGMGVGTVVGTVVGGVTAIPTTGLGMLIGAGAGAIHGPWVKVENGGKKDGKGQDEKEKITSSTKEDDNVEEMDSKAEGIQMVDQVPEEDVSGNHPESDERRKRDSDFDKDAPPSQPEPRKQPRKLETRSTPKEGSVS